MQFSKFGQKFTKQSGILQLMDDLGNALNSDKPVNMLGGGNPAFIPSVNKVYLNALQHIIQDTSVLSQNIALNNTANYANPQGDKAFIETLVAFFNRHYNWQLTSDNIALTNGSQNAFFYLFNLFGGKFDNGQDKAILLPLSPEYVGYADSHIDGKHFVSVPPKITHTTHNGQDGFFKYQIDFNALHNLDALKNGQIGAICCSRPTNPTGNVLTDDEMAKLDKLAKSYNIPLIIDNAYGAPFPNIMHTNATLTWHDNIILCFSLSKIGMAGVRTGIVVANSAVIQAISSLNAIINLAPTRLGGAIAKPLFDNDQICRLSNTHIRPFYEQKANFAIGLLKTVFKDLPQVKIHKPEGAIFLWIWFENLPTDTQTLYQLLKEQGTLIIPSEHFFVGIDTSQFRHAHECIRMSIAQDEATLTKGINCIAKTVHSLYANCK